MFDDSNIIVVLDDDNNQFLCRIDYEIEIDDTNYFLLTHVNHEGNPLTMESIAIHVTQQDDGFYFEPVLDEPIIDVIHDAIEEYIQQMY